MSLTADASPKDCSKKGLRLPKLSRKLLCTLSSLLASLLSASLLLWLTLRPSKPHFFLRDAAVYELRLASAAPRLLNSTILSTVVARNPNSRVGIYYDRLRAYAAYRGQQITADSPLPPFYQGHQDVSVLSAALSGTAMPVAASFGYEVGRDQTAGKMYLDLRLDGELRWKVGSWVSGRYRVDVDCLALIALRPAAAADSDSPPLTLAQGIQCSTNL